MQDRLNTNKNSPDKFFVYQVYSYLDDKDNPHVTIEYDGTGLLRCCGKNGSLPPEGLYSNQLLTFVKRLQPLVHNYNIDRTGFVKFKDEYYDARKLPENILLEQDVSFSEANWLEKLPEGLSVEWNLHLTGCNNLLALPENLSVGGSLFLLGCDNLRLLPKNFTVGEKIFWNTNTFSSVEEFRESFY